MLSKQKLAEIINGLGDRVQERDIAFVKNKGAQKIVIESAYSGHAFSWTVPKLKELERLTGMEVALHGGMYCHLIIELRKSNKP